MPEPRDPEDIDKMYRNVFSSAEGKIVLGDILTRGHYGVTLDPDNAAQIAEYNAALVIAHRAGAFEMVYRQLAMLQEGE
jgi:hypothetical protein